MGTGLLTVMRACGLLSATWVSGTVASKVGAPSLIGELMAGICLGPHVLQLVPEGSLADGLNIAGQLGLLMLVFEGGLMMDMKVWQAPALAPGGGAIEVRNFSQFPAISQFSAVAEQYASMFSCPQKE